MFRSVYGLSRGVNIAPVTPALRRACSSSPMDGVLSTGARVVQIRRQLQNLFGAKEVYHTGYFEGGESLTPEPPEGELPSDYDWTFLNRLEEVANDHFLAVVLATSRFSTGGGKEEALRTLERVLSLSRWKTDLPGAPSLSDEQRVLHAPLPSVLLSSSPYGPLLHPTACASTAHGVAQLLISSHGLQVQRVPLIALSMRELASRDWKAMVVHFPAGRMMDDDYFTGHVMVVKKVHERAYLIFQSYVDEYSLGDYLAVQRYDQGRAYSREQIEELMERIDRVATHLGPWSQEMCDDLTAITHVSADELKGGYLRRKFVEAYVEILS